MNRLILLFILLFLGMSSSFATDNDPKLYPGNLLSFSFFENPALTKDFRIDPQGILQLPELGKFDSKGQTLASLRAMVVKKLGLYYKNPENLTISIKKGDIFVTVLGLVKNPGFYLVPPQGNIQIAIERAGDLVDGAQMNQLQLRRQGTITQVDYRKYLDSGDQSLLPSLMANDEIFVPSSKLMSNIKINDRYLFLNQTGDAADAKDSIKIFGAISKAGFYTYNPKFSVVDYLLKAGGTTSLADTSQIKIINNLSATIFNLNEYLTSANKELIPAITAGATIFIPQINEIVKPGSTTIYVMGQVQKPGAYELGDKGTFMNAIANAGGPNQYAETRKIRIIHASGSTSYFDMQAFTEGLTNTKLPVLANGDVIYFPLKTDLNEKSWLDIAPKRAIKIIGAVQRPGRYEWANEMSILDLISNVGGPTSNADTAHIRIVSSDSNVTPAEFNLKQTIALGIGSKGLPKLSAGDTIVVPELALAPLNINQSIKIIGEVFRPGAYTYNSSYNVIDYLLLAGGITHFAAPEQIKILDNETSAIFNLKDYLDTAQKKNMPRINRGATIFVPVANPQMQAGLRTVYVMGQVQKPGAYELRKSSTFMDAVANAGGPNQYAETRKIRIIRRAGTVEYFDMQAFTEGLTSIKLPVLAAGDVIYFPLKTDLNEKSWLDIAPKRAIKIIGAVQRPGRYEWADEMNILDLISNVGGPTPNANTTQIRIVSNNSNIAPIEFNLKQTIESGISSKGLPKLNAGDTVVVPEKVMAPLNMNQSIKIIGEVYKPGAYAFNPNYTPIDYLLLAGGITHYAAPEQIRILDNESSTLFNLKDFLDTAQKKNMPTINRGATIFVPIANPKNEAGLRSVYVMGQVQKPGDYELQKTSTFMEVVANAGGPNQYAETRKIRIIRRTGAVEYFDMQAFTEGLASTKSPVLAAGDVIYFPLKTNLNEKSWLDIAPKRSIKIIGAVEKPGRYEWADEMNFLDLLANVGGTTKEADTEHVKIITNDITKAPLEFNLKKALAQGTEAQGLPKLEGGYTVVVPELTNLPLNMKNAIKILGEVYKPGAYIYNKNYTVIDYLLLAGGTTHYAAADQIRIIDSKSSVLFNLKEYLDGSKQSNLPQINEGATLFIPVITKEGITNTRTVYAMGQVQKPGAYELGKNTTFLDVLANAGGPDHYADTSKVRLIRKSGSTLVFNMEAYVEGAKVNKLPEMMNGDVIYIPLRSDLNKESWLEITPNHAVKVMGAVKAPGRFEWSDEMSLIDLLAHAGGPTENANIANVRIITNEHDKTGKIRSFRFNLTKFVEKGGDLSSVPVIKAGYTIEVPELPRSPIDNKAIWTTLDPKSTIYIFGEVGKPGRYAFNDQLNFLDILSAADGPTEKADLRDIHVIDRQGIYPQVVHVNLSLYFQTGDSELIPKVLPGDAIFIPQKTNDSVEINTKHVIKVLGEVKNPGRYRFTSNLTILDVLAAAGGPTNQAFVAKILVVNMGTGLETKASTFNLLQFSKTGDIRLLPTLREGDVIYVPNNEEDAKKRLTVLLQNLANMAIIVSQLGSFKL